MPANSCLDLTDQRVTWLTSLRMVSWAVKVLDEMLCVFALIRVCHWLLDGLMHAIYFDKMYVGML